MRLSPPCFAALEAQQADDVGPVGVEVLALPRLVEPDAGVGALDALVAHVTQAGRPPRSGSPECPSGARGRRRRARSGAGELVDREVPDEHETATVAQRGDPVCDVGPQAREVEGRVERVVTDIDPSRPPVAASTMSVRWPGESRVVHRAVSETSDAVHAPSEVIGERRIPAVRPGTASTPEQVPQALHLRRDDAPPGPTPPLLTLDETGLGQDPRVVRDGRLALSERALEVAAAHLTLGWRRWRAGAGAPGR